jgi:hypothetical protein
LADPQGEIVDQLAERYRLPFCWMPMG